MRKKADKVCIQKYQQIPLHLQVCTVSLIVRELETSVMEITPRLITMESETVLTQYFITNWTLDYKNSSQVAEGIQMTIVLKRRILNAILTVYLPTFLVLIIVYATNFFQPFFFEAIVTVNVTSLLVLTTLFISVSNSLPQTAYVKMVDIWLIFAQVANIPSVGRGVGNQNEPARSSLCFLPRWSPGLKCCSTLSSIA